MFGPNSGFNDFTAFLRKNGIENMAHFDTIMENLLQKAIDLATEAHKGQTDRAGKPYIGHITRVMRAGQTVEERMAGILHDIVEDTHRTFEALLHEGIPADVVDAVRCLTKMEGESYDQFIERVKTNPIAVAVKLNDLRDNMDVTRLPALTEKDMERLKKYHRSYSELSKLQTDHRKIVYIDMDNVLVDFGTGIAQLSDEERTKYEGRYDEVPDIFGKMQPKEGAIEAVKALIQVYDVYILSTSPWNNPSAWSDKLNWVKKYLGEEMYKRLILSHHKDLNRGDYLIDDRIKNGAIKFNGELILFGSNRFPNWKVIIDYLL